MTKRDEYQVRFRTPALGQVDLTPGSDEPVVVSRDHLPLHGRGESLGSGQNEKTRLSTSSVHFGSYAKGVEQLSSSRQSSIYGLNSRNHSQVHIEHLLPNTEADLEHYGIFEMRDGFFDATFYRPQSRNRDEMLEKAKETLPYALQTHHPLSWKYFFPRQWSGIRMVTREITTTRSGIKLLRSFLSFFIAYIVCLIPASRRWLGRYNYILVISSLFNHAGRPIGSQIDGTLLTIIGTVAGLAWGSLALYVSTSTTIAQRGYGGVLATFLVLFAAVLASLRCTFIRLYQAVIAAGVSICYTCLADTSEAVGWKKIFDYGIPWLFGQSISLLVSLVIFPASGSRELTLSFHEALRTIKQGLVFPRHEDVRLRRDLSWHFVRLSTTVRDFTIEISISRFNPEDARSVRNLMQGVIRALLSVKPDARLFVGMQGPGNLDTALEDDSLQDSRCQGPNVTHALRAITERLAGPTTDLISTMIACANSCDAVLIQMGGQRRHLQAAGSPEELSQSLQALPAAIEAFDTADTMLLDADELRPDLSTHPEAVSLFLFAHSLRQAADKVRALSTRVIEMQNRYQGWSIHLPSYPLYKQLNRSGSQVRHDRGGLTAGFYFRSKAQLERTMGDLLGQPFVPSGRNDAIGDSKSRASFDSQEGTRKHQSHEAKLVKPGSREVRLKIWRIFHRMQGFESRFALKVVFVTSLLSVPAWLEQSRSWWNRYEIWWTVVTVWLMTHPRVSGTLQDLAARLLCVVLGAAWGGFAYAADNGSPYVMAVFAIVFMVPMMYRYTQSAHPRSGIMGCISFTVVSLSALEDQGQPSTTTIAWTRGLAFAIAILASILTNWIIWPFVARHELRKSLSAMMLHLGILYRGVVSKYIYYDSLHQPSAKDIERSEMVEGRLREGFVRIRQLMELTRHEIRLRAPFDPLPYSALIEACERFFEHLVEVRQSSLYWDPSIGVSNQEAIDGLTSFRRDAAAVILMNLYILASALRADQPVPRYMPSAAAARKRLMSQMEEVEAKHKNDSMVEQRMGRRWAEVYRYAFSSALTDIVEQLQHLQRYTKEITGEAGFAALGMD